MPRGLHERLGDRSSRTQCTGYDPLACDRDDRCKRDANRVCIAVRLAAIPSGGTCTHMAPRWSGLGHAARPWA
eukprot:12775364-Alexandrium_andersonii.AAC.1